MSTRENIRLIARAPFICSLQTDQASLNTGKVQKKGVIRKILTELWPFSDLDFR